MTDRRVLVTRTSFSRPADVVAEVPREDAWLDVEPFRVVGLQMARVRLRAGSRIVVEGECAAYRGFGDQLVELRAALPRGTANVKYT